MSDHPSHPNPPQPPEIPRRLRLTRVQFIGMCVIAALPILALCGLFGQTSGQTSGASSSLQLEVKYPTRVRYKMNDVIDVTVRNISDHTIDRVTVSFDPQYISSFSGVAFTPEADRAYVVNLDDVQPGEARRVSVELIAEEYWRHRGRISASAGDESASVLISTFTYP